jgi:opacity protein-like surface antigen
VQDSYDALPGPEENNQSTPVKQYEDKVGEGSLFSQSTTEELKGSYYLRPSFVFQAPFDSVVKGVDYSLPGKPGQGIGVVVGRRIENWTLSARFGHTHQEFSNSEILPGTGISVAGDVETTSLTANVGVTVPLNQKLSFEASFGLGYTSVSHSHNMVIVTSNLDVLSDSGFSYELSLLLDYSFSERLSAFLGYRLAGIPENNGSNIAFESVNAHLFELGLGMNF